MFSQKGSQAINCSVESCRHHDENGACNLTSIQVSPCKGNGSGKPDDESMCASYSQQ